MCICLCVYMYAYVSIACLQRSLSQVVHDDRTSWWLQLQEANLRRKCSFLKPSVDVRVYFFWASLCISFEDLCSRCPLYPESRVREETNGWAEGKPLGSYWWVWSQTLCWGLIYFTSVTVALLCDHDTWQNHPRKERFTWAQASWEFQSTTVGKPRQSHAVCVRGSMWWSRSHLEGSEGRKHGRNMRPGVTFRGPLWVTRLL